MKSAIPGITRTYNSPAPSKFEYGVLKCFETMSGRENWRIVHPWGWTDPKLFRVQVDHEGLGLRLYDCDYESDVGYGATTFLHGPPGVHWRMAPDTFLDAVKAQALNTK